MTREQVDEHISAYLVQRARCDYLQLRIAELEKQLKEASADKIYDLVSITAKISDEPHGTDVSKPTERAAVKLADGYEPPQVKQLKRTLVVVRQYLALAETEVAYVDCWMRALSDMEYKVVYFHGIEKRTWGECVNELQSQYGTYYSKPGLKKIYQRSMERVYRVAEYDTDMVPTDTAGEAMDEAMDTPTDATEHGFTQDTQEEQA